MSTMTESQAERLRARIAQMETEMMEFRISMASVLMSLYEAVHVLENNQRWSYRPDSIDKLRAIRDCIINHFDVQGLKTMCFDMGVNYDNLGGDGLDDKAREFVLHMNRANRCHEIKEYCKRHRPNASAMLE